MHLLLKPYNLFYSNGVAIFSGLHDIPQNISVGFTDIINKVKVLGQLQGEGPKTRCFDTHFGNEVCVKTSK